MITPFAWMLVLLTTAIRLSAETPYADLLLRADPIVLGSIAVGSPVRDVSLRRLLKPNGQAEWRRTELCEFILTPEDVIRSSVPLGNTALRLYAFAEERSCSMSYWREVAPGKRYLWLLRYEHGIIRPVVDSYQASIPIDSIPRAWYTAAANKDWQWKLSYLLMTPDTRHARVGTGDLVDAAGWHIWFDVLAEMALQYPDPLDNDVCQLLVSLAVCCRCRSSIGTGNSAGPCQTPARENRLLQLVRAKSLNDLEGLLGTTDPRSIRLDLEQASCNTNAQVAKQARETLKALFSIQAGRCPPCR